MGAPDKPDNKQDQTLVTNNEAVKNLRLNGFQTGEDARGVSRDVIPPNFIQAIAGLTESTNTLTSKYTESLNFLIGAVKDVLQLSKEAQTQNASLIESIQITQGKFEEVNLKTTNTLNLLVAKNSKNVEEPDKKRSYKEFLLNDTIEGKIFQKIKKFGQKKVKNKENKDDKTSETDSNSNTNVNVEPNIQKEQTLPTKGKEDKAPDANPDVNADVDTQTGAEALMNIPPLQSVKVVEYSDQAIRQLCQLFKTCINVKPALAGENGTEKKGANDSGGNSILDMALNNKGILGKSSKPVVAGGTATAGKTAGRLAKVGKFAGRAAAPLAAAITVAEGVGTAYSGYKDADEQVKKGEITKDEGTVKKSKAIGTGTGQAAGGVAGASGGAVAGAAIGSVVPVVGTLSGGLLGAAVGAWLGSKGGEIVGEKVGTAVGKTIIEKPVAAEPIKKTLTPSMSAVKSNVETSGVAVVPATPTVPVAELNLPTAIKSAPAKNLMPAVKPAPAENLMPAVKPAPLVNPVTDKPLYPMSVVKPAPAVTPAPVVTPVPAVNPALVVKPAPVVNSATDKPLNPMSVVKPAPTVSLAPVVTPKTSPVLKPPGEVTTFRAAAVTMPLPAAAKSLVADAKSSTTNVNQSISKTKSTDEFTNFVAPKSIPFTNNKVPINSDKTASSQYTITAARGEPDYTKKPGTLLGDRFGNNAQALPVPSPISLTPPLTSRESSINPNISELNESMKGLAAAFAKRSPDTEAGETTNISSNNSSVSNTNSSFGDSIERDIIYMDRNKTRKQNAYRGDFF